MWTRAKQLFRRYSVEHRKIAVQGPTLLDIDGQIRGQVESVRLEQGRLHVDGWCVPRDLTLASPNHRQKGHPAHIRADVAEVHGFDILLPYGFALDIPYDMSPCFLMLEDAQGHYIHPMPRIGEADIRRADRRMIGPFLRDLARSAPLIARWAVSRDPDLRAPIKRRLRLDGPTGQGTVGFDADVLGSDAGPHKDPDPAARTCEITIVLPVYNAFDLLAEVLERVREHTDLPWRLVVIEDCSSDPAVRPFLREWHAGLSEELRDRVELIENAANKGFIGSVNTGLARAVEQGTHVVLLNSDAFVPAGWASRLLRPILEEADVATVTPMSNDAEIFTVPQISRRHDLKPGQGDAIDAVARGLDPAATRCEAPTGVGFCMAMNRDFIARLPELDTGFGRGYGEEVDWCQKAARLGGRHLAIGTLFVEHRGGSSFGSREKLAMVARNNGIISRRYPSYDAEVQAFIRADPLASARFYLALAWAQTGQNGAMPLYLAHSMGGGAEDYLQGRIAGDLEAGGSAVVVRVGGRQRWQIELHSVQGMIYTRTHDTDLLMRILVPLTRRRIVYSNGVGHYDPMALPDLLCALKTGPDDRIEVLMHDFLPLSPSYTLLDSRGIYTGVPGTDSPDIAHQVRRPDGSRASLADWRAAWRRLLEEAEEIVVFSPDSRNLLLQAYPDIETRCVVRPHRPDLRQITRADAPRADAPPVIGVLGNIGYQKGAAVLQELTRHMERSGRGKLVVIGNIDPAYALAASGVVHGSYRLQELPELVARYRITCWLIPSIWPETFSYTTHEVLATGLPVWSFNLGAQGDTVSQAVRDGRPGGILPLPGENDIPALFEGLIPQDRKQP